MAEETKEKEGLAKTFARGILVVLIAFIVSILCPFLFHALMETTSVESIDGFRILQSLILPLASFLFSKTKQSPKHYYVAIAIPLIFCVWDLVLKPILM